MIGLEMGTNDVRAVWLGAGGAIEAARSLDFRWTPAAGGVLPAAGQIAQFRAPLKALLKGGPRSTGPVAMALPARGVPVHFRDLDRFADFSAEERAYTIWRLKQSLPVDLRTDHAVAYQHVATVAGTDARRFRLLVTAAPEPVVQGLADLLVELGLECRGFLPDALAAVNVAEAALEAQGGVTAWLQVSMSGTVVMLLDAGVPVDYRLLEWGVHRMAAHLGERMNCPEDQALEVLSSGRLLAAKPAAPADLALASASMVPFMHELQISLEHQLSKVGARRLARVVLAGRGAGVPGLADTLADLLGAPCAPLHAGLAGPGLPAGQEGLFAGALGAARALEGAP